MTRPLELAAAALVASVMAGAATAQAYNDMQPFSEQGGEAVYKHICQGCHMPDGRGATGAGAYPALAGDRRLQSSAYPAMVIVGGQKAMPSFATGLTDQQISDVVNYVRSSFGNHYTDKLTPEAVRNVRSTVAPGS